MVFNFSIFGDTLMNYGINEFFDLIVQKRLMISICNTSIFPTIKLMKNKKELINNIMILKRF